jgi:hypothetical protein
MTDKTEMTEARAREILGTTISESCHPNGLYKDHGFSVEYILGEKIVIMSGGFVAEELEAIAWWMRHKA